MLRHAKDVCPASLALSGSLWLTLALSGSLSGSLWLSLARCPALSGSLWLSLAPSGSLWLSQALSGTLRLTKPLLGSQGPCSARSVATVLQHFIQPWVSHGIHRTVRQRNGNVISMSRITLCVCQGERTMSHTHSNRSSC